MELRIQDVPVDVRDAIAEQARREGRPLQDYLLRLVEREARQLQNRAAFKRTAGLRVEIPSEADPAAIVREGRDGGFESDRF